MIDTKRIPSDIKPFLVLSLGPDSLFYETSYNDKQSAVEHAENMAKSDNIWCEAYHIDEVDLENVTFEADLN